MTSIIRTSFFRLLWHFLSKLSFQEFKARTLMVVMTHQLCTCLQWHANCVELTDPTRVFRLINSGISWLLIDVTLRQFLGNPMRVSGCAAAPCLKLNNWFRSRQLARVLHITALHRSRRWLLKQPEKRGRGLMTNFRAELVGGLDFKGLGSILQVELVVIENAKLRPDLVVFQFSTCLRGVWGLSSAPCALDGCNCSVEIFRILSHPRGQ